MESIRKPRLCFSLCIIMLFTTHIAKAQNFTYPQPVVMWSGRSPAESFMFMPLERNVIFCLYHIPVDITFSKLITQVHFVNMRGGTTTPVYNSCIVIDVAIYHTNGNKIFNYVGTNSGKLTNANGYDMLEIDFGKETTIKSGNYYFAFQIKDNVSCTMTPFVQTGFRVTSFEDILNMIPNQMPSYFESISSGENQYIGTPAKLPNPSEIIRSTFPSGNYKYIVKSQLGHGFIFRLSQ